MRYRRTYAEIDLSAITHNVREYARIIPPKTELMAVVKADAYGHGAVPVLKAAVEEGVGWAGVALVEEAIELREAGFDLPILLMGGWYEEALPAFEKYRLTPAVYSLERAEQLNTLASKRKKPVKIHLKLDTGMGRLGLLNDQLSEFINAKRKRDFLRIDGVFSHFAAADESDLSFSLLQTERFRRMLSRIKEHFQPSWIHIANSAGTSALDFPEGNLFRLGIAMYGQPPSREVRNPPPLREAISWKSSIAHLQRHPANTPVSYGRTYANQVKTTIATIAVGYADGYSRLISNNGYVLIRGQKAPVAGRVCMDMIMADVGHLPEAALDDEVTLIGSQGDEYISATEMAEWTGTINYEVTCRISSRVPREYKR